MVEHEAHLGWPGFLHVQDFGHDNGALLHNTAILEHPAAALSLLQATTARGLHGLLCWGVPPLHLLPVHICPWVVGASCVGSVTSFALVGLAGLS